MICLPTASRFIEYCVIMPVFQLVVVTSLVPRLHSAAFFSHRVIPRFSYCKRQKLRCRPGNEAMWSPQYITRGGKCTPYKFSRVTVCVQARHSVSKQYMHLDYSCMYMFPGTSCIGYYIIMSNVIMRFSCLLMICAHNMEGDLSLSCILTHTPECSANSAPQLLDPL